jgi:hypothetical protein
MARVLTGTETCREHTWVENVTVARGWLGPISSTGLPMMSRLYLICWYCHHDHRVVIHATGPVDAVVRVTGGLDGIETPNDGKVCVYDVAFAEFTAEERQQIQAWSDEERRAKQDE